MLNEGVFYQRIIESFPHVNLNSANLSRHKDHMNDPKAQENVTMMVVRKQVEKAIREDNVDFVVDLKHKLETIFVKNVEFYEQVLDECTEADGSTKKLTDVANSLTKVMDVLDTVSGIRQQSSINAAIETLSRAGYEIVGGQKQKEETETEIRSKPTPQEFKEFLDWKKANAIT
jgi:hypothetical protein